MQSANANLLFAFDALLREGSVTKAARRMNVSAPAMSHTLARLRAAVGDPLFVRSGNRLVPTPRAEALRDRVVGAASEVDALLRPEKPLAIASLERTFVIRASDALIVTLGNKLDVLVRREAPKVALHFVIAPAAGQEIDLDVGVPHGRSADTRMQTLYRDDEVAVVRKDHPWSKRRVTPELLATLEHVAVATQPSKIELLSKAHRRARRPAPSRIVPSFLAAAALVRASDAYTIMTGRLAATILEPFGLRRLAATGTITIAQSWSRRVDNDAGHTWLRGCVRRASAS